MKVPIKENWLRVAGCGLQVNGKMPTVNRHWSLVTLKNPKLEL
jgi:hypothetical protein